MGPAGTVPVGTVRVCAPRHVARAMVWWLGVEPRTGRECSTGRVPWPLATPPGAVSTRLNGLVPTGSTDHRLHGGDDGSWGFAWQQMSGVREDMMLERAIEMDEIIGLGGRRGDRVRGAVEDHRRDDDRRLFDETLLEPLERRVP